MDNINKDNLKTDQYKCPSCGAIPEFDPKSQTLKCPYCFSMVNIDHSNNVSEQDIDKLLSNTTVWNNAEVIQCSNCGSKEIITKGELCTNCSFCGTTNIVKTSEIIGMKPNGICPFQKTIPEISQSVKKWVKGRFFAPNSFKKSSIIEDLKGVYSPAFTFDCDTNTNYDGRLGIKRTKTYVDSDGHRSSRSYTEYFNVSGNYDRKFDDLIIHTSSNIPTNMLEDIEPFPTTTCSDYNEKYLTGYSANTYSKDGKQTWEDFKGRSTKLIKEGILKKYRHDKVSYLNTNTTYSNSTFKYLLLPVYVGHHTYKKKNYNFYVNGCTGKVAGKAPVSGWKVFFFVLAIVGIIGLPVLFTILSNLK